MLKCEKDKKFTLSKENNKGEWEEITEIYRKNKKKRELAVIKVQDYDKITKESRKKEQNKKKQKEKCKKISRKGRQKVKGRKYKEKNRTIIIIKIKHIHGKIKKRARGI